MRSELRVSVVIPTFNCGQFIREALVSALEQTYPVDEVIVVDDGSIDNTKDVIQEFGERVRYVKQANFGVSAARNAGVANSSGDLVAFLDADDSWLPEKIEEQVAIFLADESVGLVHCGMREFDSASGTTIAVHLDGAAGYVAERIALWEEPIVIGPGGSIMVRRSVFENLGGFDPQLKIGEDWEFCFRVAMTSKIGFVPKVLVNYRNHGGNATKSVGEMERSTLLAWQKVFATDDERIRRLRSRSYGNLHKVLAGSYLAAGDRIGFVRNLIKSLYYRPAFVWTYARLAAGKRKSI